MPTQRRPAKRLLIAPAIILSTILLIVVAVPNAADRAPDPTLTIEPLAAAGTAQPCQRGQDHPTDPLADLPADTRVTSEMITACPTAYDGLRVTYVGELVGDLLRRDGGAWVLVNDDDYALGYGPLPTHREHQGTNAGLTVWLPDEHAEQVTGLGRPNTRGDVVELEGHIRRADPEDGGGLTLRADNMRTIQPAQTLSDPFDLPHAALAAFSLLAGGVLWLARRRASKP
jgi:hypothetical protein